MLKPSTQAYQSLGLGPRGSSYSIVELIGNVAGCPNGLLCTSDIAGQACAHMRTYDERPISPDMS